MKATLTIIASLLTISIFGQPQLKEGDRLTGIRFQTVINHNKKTINVDKDFKDKLVIFDNWGDWCYPCVRDLPRLDSLQRKFGDKIQILPWTEDPMATAKNIYDRINIKYDMIIPSAVEATKENNLGTNATNAIAKVWWYNGEVVAVTATKDVNAENIRKFLDNGRLEIEKKDFPDIDDFTVSRLKNNVLYAAETPVIRIKITKSIPGFQMDMGHASINENSKIIGKRFINYSLPGLYNFAYDAKGVFISDVDSIDFEGFQNTNPEETYCVEITADINNLMNYHKILENTKFFMRQALEATFGFTMVKENRIVSSFVLREIPGNERFKSTREGKEVWDKTAYYLNIQNLPIDKAFHAITSKLKNRKNGVLYATNELKYKEKISIDIIAQTDNYRSMKKALASYGLDLSVEDREKEVIVVKKIEKANG